MDPPWETHEHQRERIKKVPAPKLSPQRISTDFWSKERDESQVDITDDMLMATSSDIFAPTPSYFPVIPASYSLFDCGGFTRSSPMVSSIASNSTPSPSTLDFEDIIETSEAQSYNFFAVNNSESGSGVPPALTEKRSSAIRGNISIGSKGTGTLDIEAKTSEFDAALMESSRLLLDQFLQLIPFHVDRVMDSQGIKPYGRAIVDKSSGLSFIVKIIARALRKDNSMTASLREARELLSTKTLHEVLKFGYDELGGHDIKSCLLYSALFTASKAGSFTALVDFMIDEGCITGSLPDARRRGREIIKHLIDASFLQSTDDGLMVEVHSLICDMALEILSDIQGSQMLLSRYVRLQYILLDDFHISSSDQPDCSERTKSSTSGDSWILKAGEGLIEPPSEEEWEDAKMVVLMDNKLSSLPKRPTCSKLLTLFLQRNTCLRAIPPNFFENMSSLRIINLSKTRIKSLPQSLSKLGCLQVLVLRNCERLLYLPSEIGGLNHLSVLDLQGTEICQLPDEIGELLCLVHLQVCLYGSMDQDEITMLPSQLISKGLISKLAQLKELSIIVYPGDSRWTDIALDITTEVSNLKLCSLSFHFPEINHLEYFINGSSAWLLQTLARFNFIVGYDVKRLVSHVSDDFEYDYNQHNRCIRFVNGEDIPNAVENVLSRATAFYLDHHLTAHSLTQFGWAAVNDLEFCIVKDCPKLKQIISSQKMTGKCFPYLKFLSIHYCWNLRQICVGHIQPGTFSMLRRLSVHSCPKLKFILSRSMVDVLFNLEELTIADCQSLKNVIGNEEQADVADSSTIEDNAQDEMDADLSYVAVLEVKVLKLHYLPKLENIWYNGGDLLCLENLSVYNCPRLKNLELKSLVEVTIQKIKAETAWWNDLEWDDPALPDKLQHCVEEINGDDIWGTM